MERFMNLIKGFKSENIFSYEFDEPELHSAEVLE